MSGLEISVVGGWLLALYGRLRAGKKWVNEGPDVASFRDFTHNVSFGGGLWIPLLGRQFKFDYAFTAIEDLDNIQVFSFEFGL